ncbi:MAG: SPASM domain-containing protein [Pseudomonadota bacterium]
MNNIGSTIPQKNQVSIEQPFIRGIETTNYCGCHCRTCPFDQMTRPKGRIDEETFKLAIDNVLAYSSEDIITLHHFGDPLLHPDLVQFINYAGAKGLKTKISTVGVALTEKLIDALTESALTVLKFSFWGVNEQEFQEYQKASYQRTIKNINRFLEKNQKVRVVIELLSDGTHDMTRMEYYNQWKNFLQVKRVSNWTGDDLKVIQSTGDTRVLTNAPCGKCWTSELKILWNGDVVPCCADYDGKAVIGNIRQQNIMDIWHGEKMNTLRQMHAEGRRAAVELCRFCGQVPHGKPDRNELLH